MSTEKVFETRFGGDVRVWDGKRVYFEGGRGGYGFIGLRAVGEVEVSEVSDGAGEVTLWADGEIITMLDFHDLATAIAFALEATSRYEQPLQLPRKV